KGSWQRAIIGKRGLGNDWNEVACKCPGYLSRLPHRRCDGPRRRPAGARRRVAIGGSTMTTIRRAVVMFATVALAAGVFVSGASAAPPLCGSKPCAEEISSACGAFSGQEFKACKQ